MLLGDRLRQALAITRRNGALLAVVHLSLDEMRPLIDSHGLARGEAWRAEISQRLQQGLRGGDSAAQISHDEFVLLLGEITDLPQLERALHRIQQLIATPASLGVAITPTGGTDAATLLRHANQALLRARQDGGNTCRMFDMSLDSQACQQQDHLIRIALALAHAEFLLHYQPRVNMRSGTVTGLEALIRWQHPERGLLMPQDFLPQTEGHPANLVLCNWAIDEALQQAGRWAAQGIALPISVNLSAQQLQQTDFVPRLAERLAHARAQFPRLQPAALELEIREAAALADIANVARIIDDCLALGVSCAIDDFGASYSSLTALKRLQAQALKVDQSLVRDMLENTDDLAIVEGVVGLTTAFQRKVIAEGVESIQHGMMLMHLGCDLAQGYGIARPMPAAEVPLWLASFQPPPAWSDSLSYPWQREDFPLLAVEFDHQHWLSCLQERLAAQHPLQADDDFFDPASGRFGTWYKQHGQAKFGHLAEFTQVGQLHEHVYRLGKRIAQLYEGHQPDMAQALLPHLQTANENLYTGLAELRHELATQTRSDNNVSHRT